MHGQRRVRSIARSRAAGEPFRPRDRLCAARYYDRDGVHQVVRAKTVAAVLEKRDAALSGHDRAQTIGGFLTWWVDEWLPRRVRDGRMAESTLVEYSSIVRVHLVPAAGAVRLADLTVGHVEDLLDGVRPPSGPSRVRRCRRGVSG